MTAANGFKRLGLAIAAVIAVGMAALAVAAVLISADAARDGVKAQIQAVTGLDPVLRGPVSVSMFPAGSVSFADVALAGGDGGEPALVAERLVAHLRFLPLLAGRIEIADISLERPRITVDIAADGRSNWSPLLAILARALKPSASRSDRVLSFSEIRVVNGTVTVRDAVRQIAETLTGTELALAWPSISRSFTASGRFVWRDQPIDASVTIGDFLAALTGDSSGLKLRLAGAPIKAAFDGTMSNSPSLKLDGTLAIDSPSLREAMRWVGDRPIPGGGFGRFALKAQTHMVGGTIALSNVNVELDGNVAEGVLTYATVGPRQTWQGTLAADGLDLTPYVAAIKLTAGNAREWDRLPIVLDGLAGLDLDLRLSAARINVGAAKLGRTAVAASLRGGKLQLTIGESQAFNGVITGTVGIAKAEAGAEFKTQIQFANVDLESCLNALIGMRRLEGKGTIAVELDGAGTSVLNLTRTLNGTVNVTSRQGAITGLDVEQLLRRLERRPLSGSGDFRTGRTPYDNLNVALTIAQGVATVEEVQLNGAMVRLGVTGSAMIPTREVDLKGTASLLSSATDVAFELPFIVQGAWDDPLMLPDPQSLIKRSGAAAPLLDAVRDRKTRDAVRNAIERLTGAAPRPAVPAQ